MPTFIYRPIEVWPGELTPRANRKGNPFRANFNDTIKLLSSELEHLKAGEAVIQLAVTEGEVRNDGLPRAGARPSHPGVIVAFETKKQGSLQFATDQFEGFYSNETGWHANLRAIALGLQALRAVDRYGITKSGQQYTGWKALPSADHWPAAKMSKDEAARFLVSEADFSDQADVRDMGAFKAELVGKLLNDPNGEYLQSVFRRGARNLHPDMGGDPEKFMRLKEAKAVLEL